jgi:hypothetical protein
MSSIARWSYKASATVLPFISKNGQTNQNVYGEPYEILCNYTAKAEQRRDDKGNEFVSQHLIYTEDSRPKYMDKITLDYAGATPQEIRSRTVWDMELFADTHDYLLVT